jgi:hypothetical protein
MNFNQTLLQFSSKLLAKGAKRNRGLTWFNLRFFNLPNKLVKFHIEACHWVRLKGGFLTLG